MNVSELRSRQYIDEFDKLIIQRFFLTNKKIRPAQINVNEWNKSVSVNILFLSPQVQTEFKLLNFSQVNVNKNRGLSSISVSMVNDGGKQNVEIILGATAKSICTLVKASFNT